VRVVSLGRSPSDTAAIMADSKGAADFIDLVDGAGNFT
jgi:hypothetical protein